MLADWNTDPDDLDEVGVIQAAGRNLLVTDDNTCISPNCNSKLTFAMVCPSAKMLYQSISADTTWTRRPHRPVRLELVQDPTAVTRQVLAAPPTIPVTRPCGPSPRPTCYDHPRRVAEQALKLSLIHI